MSLFVDANVPMYAEGRDHPFKGPSAAFMMAVARRQVDAVSDVEVLQEILHRHRAVCRQSDGLVVRHSIILGYTDFSLQRASSTSICQSTPRCMLVMSMDHADTSS